MEKSTKYVCNSVSKKKTIVERLFEEFELRGISVPEFERQTGIKKDRVYKWKQEGTSPKVADERIITDWLKMENEKMVIEEETPYRQKLREIKNGGKPDIPIFGGFTTLGNIQVFDDGGLKHKVVAQLPADVFPGCDYAEKAKGDSMYPLIMNQALLIGKTCPVNGITWGEKYIIKTREGMDTTKFIHPSTESGKIKLKAYNKNIPDQEVEVNEIVFVCRVHWIVNPT